MTTPKHSVKDAAIPRFPPYWTVYGGFWALFTSGYFLTSAILTFITSPWWLTSNWWERVILVVPSMLGFSLGGYVMLLAVGSETFMQFIARAGGKDDSVLMSVSAAFVHFIVVQFLSLISAFLYIAMEETVWKIPLENQWPFFITLRPFAAGASILCFFYAIMTGLAATMRIFNLTHWYVAMVHAEPKK